MFLFLLSIVVNSLLSFDFCFPLFEFCFLWFYVCLSSFVIIYERKETAKLVRLVLRFLPSPTSPYPLYIGVMPLYVVKNFERLGEFRPRLDLSGKSFDLS